MDYIIKDGWIVNGKKEKPFYGDLVIKNGKIAEVGAHVEIPADFPKERVLNAAGGYITPGFIDIHRHGDWQAFGNGDDELLNRQGLTTVVNGNCGLSVAPAGERFGKEIAGFLSSVTGEFRLGEDKKIDAPGIMSTMSAYMSALEKEKRSVNTGMLAGNGTIRAGVKGYAPGKLSKEELHQVWKAVEESLAAGALGISLGIAYAPEFEYDRDGLVEALQPLKGTDIPITTHIRNEGDGILLALQEVISVAEELQIPLHVSHMKCIGQKNWGGTPVKILKLFDQAAERKLRCQKIMHQRDFPELLVLSLEAVHFIVQIIRAMLCLQLIISHSELIQLSFQIRIFFYLAFLQLVLFVYLCVFDRQNKLIQFFLYFEHSLHLHDNRQDHRATFCLLPEIFIQRIFHRIFHSSPVRDVSVDAVIQYIRHNVSCAVQKLVGFSHIDKSS